MKILRRVGAVAGVVAAVMVLAGCGGDSDGGRGEGKASASPRVSSVPSPSVVAPRDALEDYQQAGYSGCTDAPSCQELMKAELAAAVKVRDAMRAKDPSLYAVPIGLVDEAERRADHYGRDNLGARGNMVAVMQPLQGMASWFGEHPEG
ncbi:hypothetical protein [Streptomyces griseosporeus]|uniref:hypothetical protein n=1 Tax=Streptomyces griseosporeus TaxID=1910 RepID=UPI0037B3698B